MLSYSFKIRFVSYESIEFSAMFVCLCVCVCMCVLDIMWGINGQTPPPPSLGDYSSHQAQLTWFQCTVEQCYHATTCSDIRTNCKCSERTVNTAVAEKISTVVCFTGLLILRSSGYAAQPMALVLVPQLYLCLTNS